MSNHDRNKLSPNWKHLEKLVALLHSFFSCHWTERTTYFLLVSIKSGFPRKQIIWFVAKLFLRLEWGHRWLIQFLEHSTLIVFWRTLMLLYRLSLQFQNFEDTRLTSFDKRKPISQNFALERLRDSEWNFALNIERSGF